MAMAKTPPTALTAARRAVGVMFFICGAGFANWLARIPSIREQLEMNDRTLGLVLLGTTVGALTAFRGAGWLIARFGSKTINTWAASAACCMLFLPAMAPAPIWVAAGLFVLGACNGLMDVSMNAQAVEVERRLRKPVLGSFHGLFSLGGLVGASTGSAVASFGVEPRYHLMGVGAVLLTPTLVASRFLLPAETEKVKSRSSTWPSGPLLALGLVVLCSSVGEGAMADWAAVYMREVLHTSMGTAGLVFAAYSLAMLAGRFSGDRLTSHFGPVPVVRVGGVLVAVGLVAGLVINHPAAMTVGVMMVGAGLSQVVPVVFRAAGQVPGISAGSALATIATISYSGFLMGPPAIGIVSHYATLRVGLGVVAVLALLMSCLAGAVKSAEPAAEDAPLLPGPQPEVIPSAPVESFAAAQIEMVEQKKSPLTPPAPPVSP